MGRWSWILSVIALLCAGLWWLARPQPLTAGDVPAHTPDLANGELMFHAGGCASCHGEAVDGGRHHGRMGGGLELATPAGVFRVPNISPHAGDGIGDWSDLDFLNAMQRGISPSGRHYYPSFPYTSYTRMKPEDLLDLRAYLDTLPAVEGRTGRHELHLQYRFRRLLGLWKRLFLDPSVVIEVQPGDPQLERGRYLVEGPGHCGECHTPRTPWLALDHERWLAGAALPGGEGKASNLTPHDQGLADWSVADIAYFLETGVDADFDVVGGPMVAVQENMARLKAEDRAAIAAYLKTIPARP